MLWNVIKNVIDMYNQHIAFEKHKKEMQHTFHSINNCYMVYDDIIKIKHIPAIITPAAYKNVIESEKRLMSKNLSMVCFICENVYESMPTTICKCRQVCFNCTHQMCSYCI